MKKITEHSVNVTLATSLPLEEKDVIMFIDSLIRIGIGETARMISGNDKKNLYLECRVG